MANHKYEQVSPYVRLVHNYVVGSRMQTHSGCPVDHALHYFKDGEGEYFTENRSYMFQPGMVFFLRPFDSFEFTPHHGIHMHMYNIHFDLIEQEDSRLIERPNSQASKHVRENRIGRIPLISHVDIPVQIEVADKQSYEMLFTQMSILKGQTNPMAMLQMKAAMLQLLALLMGQGQHHKSGTVFSSGRDSVHLAIQHMKSNLNTPLSLDELARITMMSPSYLIKQFHKYCRCSPIRYWNKMRIEQCKWELLYTDKDIVSIATDIGYESLQAFYHAFKRLYGIAPGAYRSAYRTMVHKTQDGMNTYVQ